MIQQVTQQAHLHIQSLYHYTEYIYTHTITSLHYKVLLASKLSYPCHWPASTVILFSLTMPKYGMSNAHPSHTPSHK